MKTLTRVCASTALALIVSATCFAQHYTQTNLISNTAGVAPVTDPGSDRYHTASRPMVGL
jgi:hypothetical protein